MEPGDLVWYYEAGGPPRMANVRQVYAPGQQARISWVDEDDPQQIVHERDMVPIHAPDHSYCVKIELNDRDEYVPREKRADGSALPVRKTVTINQGAS